MNKQILKLAVPSILANITIPLVGMVDIAISGRLGSAAAIGAIAVGSMIFDLLYWNFAFLRVGTAGLTAQAYGRNDHEACTRHFSQGILSALLSAAAILLIQYLFVELCFLLINCSAEVEQLARKYFFIRVWAAPATLALFVFKGWFIGMQNTVCPMAIDIVVNVVNLCASFWLGLHTPMGFSGIAAGTVIAQYTGVLLSIVLMLIYYRKHLRLFSFKKQFKWKDLRSFYVMNTHLFVRSLCFMLIYCGFTSLSARYGDTPLAVGSMLMKLLMLFSYFIDGFAYAGEALCGRYIGAKDKASLRNAIHWLFVWSAGIGLISTIAYTVGGEWMLRLMTSESTVLEASRPYLVWLTWMPLVSCAAFMWDGIYIGATASVPIRNAMIYAGAAFYVVYFSCEYILPTIADFCMDGLQALMFAYFAHLVVRAIYLSLNAKKHVYGKLG